MKMLTVMALLFIVTFGETALFAYKPRMTKTVEPHYSGVSGRRYYFPTVEEQNEQPIIINLADLNESNYYLNPNNPQTAEDVARERNRIMRAAQLERSSKKPAGTYGYYLSSEAARAEGVPYGLENR